MPRLTKRDRVMQQFDMTPGDVVAIQQAAHRVWNDVAYDCLQAVAEDKGKSIYDVTMSRAEVIEIVLDAGRIEEALQPRRHHRTQQMVDPLTPGGRRFLEAHYDQPARWLMDQIMRDTFTYARWGM